MENELLNKAYTHCVAHGHRFTAPRAQVLNILINANKPLGAYDILQQLGNKMDNPKPPTVYRAIQFWHKEGFIHCIDSLKSYVACTHGRHIGQAQFLICNQCDFVQELECAIDFSAAKHAANHIHFSALNFTTEIKGYCQRCPQAM